MADIGVGKEKAGEGEEGVGETSVGIGAEKGVGGKKEASYEGIGVCAGR